MKNIFL